MGGAGGVGLARTVDPLTGVDFTAAGGGGGGVGLITGAAAGVCTTPREPKLELSHSWQATNLYTG
jgi:hypothetical protein